MVTIKLWAFLGLLLSLVLQVTAVYPAITLTRSPYDKHSDAEFDPWGYAGHLLHEPSSPAEIKDLALAAYNKMKVLHKKPATPPTVMTALHVNGGGVFFHSSLKGVKDDPTPPEIAKLVDPKYPHTNAGNCGEFAAIALAIKAGHNPIAKDEASMKAAISSANAGGHVPPCKKRVKQNVQCYGCSDYMWEWFIPVI